MTTVIVMLHRSRRFIQKKKGVVIVLVSWCIFGPHTKKTRHPNESATANCTTFDVSQHARRPLHVSSDDAGVCALLERLRLVRILMLLVGIHRPDLSVPDQISEYTPVREYIVTSLRLLPVLVAVQFMFLCGHLQFVVVCGLPTFVIPP